MSRVQSGNLLLDPASLGRGPGERERAFKRRPCFLRATQLPAKLGPDGVDKSIVLKLAVRQQPVNDRKARGSSALSG